jgi:hypothetical protein
VLADHSLLYTMCHVCKLQTILSKCDWVLKKLIVSKQSENLQYKFSNFKVGIFESLSDMCLIITPSPAHAPWQSHQINGLYKRLSLVLAKLFVHTSGLPSDPS